VSASIPVRPVFYTGQTGLCLSCFVLSWFLRFCFHVAFRVFGVEIGCPYLFSLTSVWGFAVTLGHRPTVLKFRRNFDRLPFTPLWSPASVIHERRNVYILMGYAIFMVFKENNTCAICIRTGKSSFKDHTACLWLLCVFWGSEPIPFGGCLWGFDFLLLISSKSRTPRYAVVTTFRSHVSASTASSVSQSELICQEERSCFCV